MLRRVAGVKAQNPRRMDSDGISYAKQILDNLIALHLETDPTGGKDTQKGKMDKATTALNYMSTLNSLVNGWAERQIYGAHYCLIENPDRWISTETADLHKNEEIWYENELPELLGTNLSLESERAAIAHILRNTAGTGILGWRNALADALYALNEGEITFLTTPVNTQQKGKAYTLKNLKWAAIKWAYYLMGNTHPKKEAAFLAIAERCGVSLETILDWEKFVAKEYDPKKMIRDGITASAIKFKEMSDAEGGIAILGLRNNDDVDAWFYSKDDTFNHLRLLNFARDYPLSTLKEKLDEAGFRRSKG